MNALPLLALVAAASVPARAQAGPAARIGALVENQPGMTGAAFPPSSSIPVPPSAPAAAPQTFASVVPAGLWATLQPPQPATLSWLSSRIPGLDAAHVRVVPLGAADAMFAAAVAQGEAPLDFFTDPGFRGSESYYFAPETVVALFARYEVRVLTPASGTTKDGRPFALQALVVGGGRIDSLYDLDQFDFDNPYFPDYRYKLAGRVTERIQGPGDLLIEGAWLHAGILTPRIERVVKLSATEGRVETNYGNRVKPSYPIRRR